MIKGLFFLNTNVLGIICNDKIVDISLFINSWKDVTRELLETFLLEYKDFNWDIPELTVEYWGRHINI